MASLRRKGKAVTRQNYIDAMWDHAADGEWTAEHEDSLPRELREE
jgi:hypothetical protein